jgi:hypothetical protein
MERAMGIEPTFKPSEAIEHPGFPSLGPSRRYIVNETVPEWQDQDGGFGALQPPATIFLV